MASTLHSLSPLSYGRLHPSDSVRFTQSDPPNPNPNPHTRTRTRTILLVAATLLLLTAVACAIPTALKFRSSSKSGSRSGLPRPTRAITRTCSVTQYPDLCISSLVGFPGALTAGAGELVQITVNMTAVKLGRAMGLASEIGNWEMDSLSRAAYEDCLELMEDSVDLVVRSLVSVSPVTVAAAEEVGSGAGNGQVSGSTQDVMTWLSAALTNQDTCTEGFQPIRGTIKDQVAEKLKDLSELVSNCLAIYSANNGADDFAGTPIQNRRLLESEPESDSGFPKWMSRTERELLGTPVGNIQADITVAQDGSGDVKKIMEAIKKAPEKSNRRIIIHVKAGRYSEPNLKVGRKKMNLWFLGEGKGKTVITGRKSVARDKITTFHTASFAATGTGFVVRDITFENEAGPGSHQAVALRVGADHAVVYRCEIKGYQDTLYVHSQRQFYRECDIYGTVDFIFGNAAVVFQNCTMWGRKPLPLQKNTITAQNRKDPNQNTGMSIQSCLALATSELEAVKSNFPTYLGRPWKVYSRVVYIQSYLGDHIDPRGWLEWNATTPLDKLYYGEYENYGPRADTGMRVKWPGLHVTMSRVEAEKFTVAQFIFGQEWITSTGVAYQAGLSS